MPIDTELHHTINYLKCMQMKYDNQLFYNIDIPREMENIHIPKLCIQLLVKNSIKFTSKKRLPWHISISGEITSKSWRLLVKDNGPGFAKESLERINQEIEKISQT